MIWKRMTALTMVLAIAFSLMYMRTFTLTQDQNLVSAATNQGRYTLPIASEYGNIYDYNGKHLNNLPENKRTLAVITPSPDTVEEILPYVTDTDTFYKQLSSGMPFTLEVANDVTFKNIPTFNEVVRTTSDQLAPHIIGYVNDNKGVSGIEKGYDSVLRGAKKQSSMTFSLDGTGKIIPGDRVDTQLQGRMTAGVVLTIDKDIQAICEEVAANMKKGAIVVMTPKGDLRAVVSVPDFDPTDVGSSLTSADSPLINRAFSAYNVGSVFKIVTAAEALENGVSTKKEFTCKGWVDIGGQIFRCHKLQGHDTIDMQEAMAESCNPYFIALGKMISTQRFSNRAYAMGFGQGARICKGIISADGNLQSPEQLQNPAELANLSFGQGMLMGTPLQVTEMTAAIVNGGMRPTARLVLGTTEDGKNIYMERDYSASYAIDPKTALTLWRLLNNAINGSTASAAIPYNVSAGGKTSTAQTGQFKPDPEDPTGENKKEIVQAWFTGFFPAEKPEYVVTVLVEDGDSGNLSAAPIFREIAERVSRNILGNN